VLWRRGQGEIPPASAPEEGREVPAVLGRFRRLRLQRDLYRSNRDLLRRHPDGWHLSDSADENAILIDTDETVTLTNATVTKSGDSDGGDSYITSFTGDASQIISNDYTLYANGVALEGTK